MPVAFSCENRRGGVGIFMPCRVPEDLILPPQKVRKADLLRPVFDERAYAVLPHHAPGKGHGHAARVDPVQPVQPQVNPVMPNPIFTQSFSTGMDTPVAAQPAAPAEEEDDGDYFDDLLSILNKRS